MNYYNPNDAPVTTETYEVDETAYRIGVYGARVYSARNETAPNPFKPLTRAWYSFNLGARELLLKLPDVYVDGPLKGKAVPRGSTTHAFDSGEYSFTFTTRQRRK